MTSNSSSWSSRFLTPTPTSSTTRQPYDLAGAYQDRARRAAGGGCVSGAQGSGKRCRPFLTREGERFCNFSSNDYLGLSRHPTVRALQQARIVTAWAAVAPGTSAATPRRIGAGGELADWLGYPRALLFISGFAANQAVIAALMGKDDRIIADRVSHASLLEAASLSPAQLRRFAITMPLS
ncbi:aminotransferase class I/II-fold pyridoxal phosphate-dependent enzyme [Enterobacter hormaechei]